MKREYINLHDAARNAEWYLTGIGRRYEGRRTWWISTLVLAMVVTTHAILLAPLALGFGRERERNPEEPGVGGVMQSGGEVVLSPVLLEVSPVATSRSDEALSHLASKGIVLEERKLLILNPEPTAYFEVEETLDDYVDEEAPVQTAEDSGRAAIFGQYVDQLSGRIDRAWIRPRSPVKNHRFRCAVRIEQDRRGSVGTIELTRCDSDGKWQQSLVNAIQSTSPLPVPPSESMFTSTLLLSFSGDEYLEGSSLEERYERQVLAGIDPTVATTPSNTESMAQQNLHQSSALKLTIVGNRVTWQATETLTEPPR